MITKIQIKNFQAQRQLDISPSAQITSIIGESDIGKSSTIRALYWFFTNKAPSDFITWGQDECSVTIEIDGHSITRLRNKKKNVYILDGQEYACLRQDVPPQLQDILCICRENFQTQYEPSFWFCETGGELAKKLNAIVNLEIVDYFFGELNSKIRNVKTIKDINENEYQKKNQELEQLSQLQDFEKDVIQCERYQQKIQENEERIEFLNKRIINIIHINEKILHGQKLNVSLTDIINIYQQLEKCRDVYIHLRQIIENIEERQKLHIFDFDFTLLQKIFDKIEPCRKQWRTLNELLEDIRQNIHDRKELKQKNATIQKQLEEAMKGRCPLCGRSGHDVHDIIDECCIEYDLEKGELK